MLNLGDRYPGRAISGDLNYPQGKARNAAIKGDNTGTPWEQDLVNDLLGALQAIVKDGGVTAVSGVVENANTSDVLTALRAIVDSRANDRIRLETSWAEFGIALASNASPIGLTAVGGTSGYTLTGGTTIQVPTPGLYAVDWQVPLQSTNTSSLFQVSCALAIAGSAVAAAMGYRTTTSTNEVCACVGHKLVEVSNPATQLLTFVLTNPVTQQTANGGSVHSAFPRATIRRIYRQ